MSGIQIPLYFNPQEFVKFSRGEICVANFKPSTNGASLGRYLETNNKND